MLKIALISASLSATSRSALLIEAAADRLTALGHTVEVIDLRQLDLPFCNGGAPESYPAIVAKLHAQLAVADALVFGMPVYCYSLSGALKNFIDLFAASLTAKPFGVCCAAGTKLSYLASADLFKILGFECQCVGVQPTVLADGSDFTDDALTNERTSAKVDAMLTALLAQLR